MVRHSLRWPVADFSAVAQDCYRELREVFFLPQLSEAILDHLDEAHQDAMERLQQSSNEAAERLARAGNKLAWAGGVLAVISVVLGVMQVVLALQGS